ncbi:universal stress protein, partial [Klebsiella pneumoniae]|uniref:universal stress protein n=1 Tax=Klebsiella pneumoniae TaxID=573 RepID=UPI003013CB17
RHALETASRLGACFDAIVTALHVYEQGAQARIPNLCAWIPVELKSRCQVRELVRDGNAAEEIVRVAGEGYDLLVIGAAAAGF